MLTTEKHTLISAVTNLSVLGLKVRISLFFPLFSVLVSSLHAIWQEMLYQNIISKLIHELSHIPIA